MTPDLFLTIIVALCVLALLIFALIVLMAVVEAIKSDPVPKPKPQAPWLAKQEGRE